MHCKAFRAAAAGKLFFSYGKMTMPAAKLIALNCYQRQDFVFAGFHILNCSPQPFPHLIIRILNQSGMVLSKRLRSPVTG